MSSAPAAPLPARTGPDAALALLPLPLVAVLPETSFPGVATAAAALALLGLALRGGARPSPVQALLLAWVAWAVASVAWSVDAGQSVFVSAVWLGGAALVLAAPGTGPRLWGALALAVGVASAVALGQATTGFADLQHAAAGLEGVNQQYVREWVDRGRVHGPFASPDTLAGFLVATLPACAALALAPGAKLVRVLGGVTALAGMAALVLTRSVGGALSLGAAAVLAGAAWMLPRGKGRHLLGLVVLAGGAGAAVLLSRLATGQANAFHSATERWEDWQNAWSLAQHHPWLGVGAGAFESAFNAFSPPGRRYSAHAHNAVLEVLVELGLPGAVLVAVGYAGAAVWALRRAARGALWDAVLAVGVLASCFHHQLDYDLHVVGAWGLFLALAALETGTARAPRGPRTLQGAVGVLAGAVMLLSVGAGWSGRGIPRVPGEDVDVAGTARGAGLLGFDARAQLALASDLAIQAARTPNPVVLEELEEAATRAAELAPWLPAGPMLLARTRASRGDLGPALEAYDAAIARSCCSSRLRQERLAVSRAAGRERTQAEDLEWLQRFGTR